MEDKRNAELPPDAKRVLGAEGWIVGFGLGLCCTLYGVQAWLAGVKNLPSPVMETLMVAFYLTLLVAYGGLKMPVFFHRSPFWSTFTLVMFAGHVSLLFDSFAVVLLLATGITFVPVLHKTEGENRYNQFFVKVASAFAALTVGGGFYLGELWGLPWYISNGLANIYAGLPMMIVLTPACVFLALVTAWLHPVRMEPVVFDRAQLVAAAEFVVGLLLIILTHEPFLCIGVLCLYTVLRRSTVHLIKSTGHELAGGGLNALGLIAIAVFIELMGYAVYIQPLVQGEWMFVVAAISSPFAGAMAPPVHTLHDFYVGLSYLMLGAPMFVFSSLVAIVVFTGRLEHDDLPPYMQRLITLWGRRQSSKYIEEKWAYSLLVVPMTAGLGVLLALGNNYGWFLWAAGWLGVTM